MIIYTTYGERLFEYDEADLRGAYLREADLRGAYLREANLSKADLRGADLREANLRGADLREANLRWANLRWANLREADLRGAYLREANLSKADLRGADLRWADLRWANLRWADLRWADLREAKLPPFQIPAGDLIVWKRVRGFLIKLLIPTAAKRTAVLTDRKCRAEFAKVLWVEGNRSVLPNPPTVSTGLLYGKSYEVGAEVWPDKYCDDIRTPCSHGIHFYLTKGET